MLRFLIKLGVYPALLTLFLSLGNVPVLAFSDIQDKDQVYIGLKGSYNSIDGDFDQDLYEFKEGVGEGLVFGFVNANYTLEFSYSQSEHEKANIINSEPIARLYAFNINAKYSPESFVKKRVRPYGQIGYDLARLKVENAFDPLTGKYGECKYTGSGWHLGCGILFKINNKLSVDGSFTYHRVYYDEYKMLGQKYEVPENELLMTDTAGSIGIRYCFN